MALLGMEMVDVPVEGPALEERGDVEMIDILIEEAIPKQGVMEIILDPRIIKPESHAT